MSVKTDQSSVSFSEPFTPSLWWPANHFCTIHFSSTSLSSSSSVIWAGIKHGGFQHLESQMLKSFLSSTNNSLHHHHPWSLWAYLGNEVHCKSSELCPHFRARKQANALSYLCIHRGRRTRCWCAAHGTEVSLGRRWCWLFTLAHKMGVCRWQKDI